MFSYLHRVNYYETDRMGVVHHSNYVRFMEEARVAFLEDLGWGYAAWEARGVFSPVVNLTCNYLHPTTFGDEVAVAVKVEKVTPARLVLAYTMTCDDKVVCTASSTHCFTDSTNRPINTRKAYPEFYRALEANAEA